MSQLHPRNPHSGRYDFKQLSQSHPPLKAFLVTTPAGDTTIKFSNPDAVLCLNKALLAHYYQIDFWQIPEGHLCPPIPGRADYIHFLGDILSASLHGTLSKIKDDKQEKEDTLQKLHVPLAKAANVPTGNGVRALDIGTGANCIYPIIGTRSFGWKFDASEIQVVSFNSAKEIIKNNENLKGIHLIKQKQIESIFDNVIEADAQYDVTLCNPPFHASLEEAVASSQRKQENLLENKLYKAKTKQKARKIYKSSNDVSNFGGQKAELWCDGGEINFIISMINQSKPFAEQVSWFTTLVSKKENIRLLKRRLQSIGASCFVVHNMTQGQKISRVLAWSFMTPAQLKERAEKRWAKK